MEKKWIALYVISVALIVMMWITTLAILDCIVQIEVIMQEVMEIMIEDR